METIAVPFRDEAAVRIKRAAADIGMPLETFIATAAEQLAAGDSGVFGEPLSADQIAHIEAGLAAEREGRIVYNEEAERRLAARRAR